MAAITTGASDLKSSIEQSLQQLATAVDEQAASEEFKGHLELQGAVSAMGTRSPARPGRFSLGLSCSRSAAIACLEVIIAQDRPAPDPG